MKRISLVIGMCLLTVGCSKELTNDQIIFEINKCTQQGFFARSIKSWDRTVRIECEFNPFSGYLNHKY